MFRIKKIKFLFLLLLFSFTTIYGQLIKITAPNLLSENDIYTDENNNLYSTLITFRFQKKMIDLQGNEVLIDEGKIIDNDFKIALQSLKKDYGNFQIFKAVKNFHWGDTLAINKRTGEMVRINDLSQIYQIIFEMPVLIDNVVSKLESFPLVEFAEGPIIAYETVFPNDPYYLDNNYSWSFDAINAEGAWDITTGSPLIGVGFSDKYGGVNQLHQELVGKVVWDNLNGNYGGHGIITAGVVGALTNNSSGIASLGWNVNLLLNKFWGSSTSTVNGVNQLIQNGADVINFSWVSGSYYSTLALAIENALLQGRVCVASAGNDEWTQPSLRYPAAYNFGSTGQVIAVSATTNAGGAEKFIEGFNYSPGNDPVNDPINSFIDCAAPGGNYRALSDVNSTGTVHIWAATSVSAPFVSALAALMLSVNSTLTPNEVYDIIRRTSDRIGQYSYGSAGWNRYMGYGRIDAANAVNVANGAPAKPRGMEIAWQSNHPKISWEAGEETNLSHYEIYKKRGISNYTHIANTTNTFYVDNTEWKYVSGQGKIYVNYKVKAVDTDNDKSVYSDKVRAAVNDNSQNKAISQTGEETESLVYKLYANFPNPFNPSTEIRYTIPEGSFVSLKIYNILGEEVISLIDAFQPAGSYRKIFDASNLNSGIYIYKLQAGKFSDVKKMLLLK